MAATTIRFPALGTTAQLTLAGDANAAEAEALMRQRLDELDSTASRFRPDSELMLVHASRGEPTRVSALLAGAVHAALAAARSTDGVVDPTIGAAIRAAGYDRDFASLNGHVRLRTPAPPAPGWSAVGFDPRRRMLTLPRGVELDLGATAKALAADRIAREIHLRTGDDVLVNLGGDIAVAGARSWDVGVADHHAAANGDQVVTVSQGGIATSSTVVRRWRAGDRLLHHIIDPATGQPAESPWRTVTVAARSCLLANTASTAALVLGARAAAWLGERGLPARLVAADGAVEHTGGWPEPSPKTH